MKKTHLRFYAVLSFLLTAIGINAQPGNLPTPYCMPLYTQGHCTQPGPSNAPGNFVNDFINSVKTIGANVDINNINSGCNTQNFPSIGLRNYIYHKCQHNLSVSPGQIVTFSIQIGNFFQQGVAVYIDWNLDNTFSNPAELVAASPTPLPGGGWGTYTVQIPPAQPTGIYRMRVRCAFGTNGPLVQPCTSHSNGEAEDYDVYVGTISSQVTASLSSNAPICAGNTLSLNLTYTSQCTPTYTWIGPNAFMSTAQNPTITNAQPSSSGNYTMTIMCNTTCPVTQIINVAITPTNMVSNAGPSQTLCSTNVTTSFSATPASVGNGTWTLVSGGGTILGSNNQPNATGWFPAPTQYYNVFAWTIGAPGCQSTSTMAVTVHSAVANAGTSQTFCDQNSVMLYGNMPPNVTASWFLVAGSGTIVSPTSGTTNVTSLGTGTNIFQWVLTHPTCGTSISQVTITNYATPTLSAISNPTAVCSGNQASITASGAMQYNWQPSGTGSMIVVSPTVASTYTVIGNNGPCFGSPITISVNVNPAPTQAVANPSACICSTTWTLSGNAPSAGTGMWSLVSGIGLITSPTSPTTGITALGIGTNVFAWTITLGNCTSVATTTLFRDPFPTTAVAGPNQTLCLSSTATLMANTPAIGTGSWTLISGSGVIVSPTSPVTQITGLGTGTNIFMWTISAQCCPSSSSTLAIVNNSAITVSASTSTNIICAGGSAVLTASGASNYTWMPSGGNSPVEIVTPSATTVYTVTGEDGNCIASATITQSVVVCTGLNVISVNNDQLKIYPNPFKDELKIVSSEALKIKLMDVNGKEVLAKDISGETLINTSALPKGVYFMQIISDKSTKAIKLIKD